MIKLFFYIFLISICSSTVFAKFLDSQTIYNKLINSNQNKAKITFNFNFKSGEAILNIEDKQQLVEVGRAISLLDPKVYEIHIHGHTDNLGNSFDNMHLSYKRADAVRKYLQNKVNISYITLRAEGFGEERHIVSNDTKDNRAKNRRVELLLVKKSNPIMKPKIFLSYGHQGNFNYVSSNDEQYLITTSKSESKLILWSIPQKRIIKYIDIEKVSISKVSSINFSANSTNVFISDDSETIVVYDITTDKFTKIMLDDKSKIQLVIPSIKNNIITVITNERVYLYDINYKKKLYEYKINTKEKLLIAADEYGETIALSEFYGSEITIIKPYLNKNFTLEQNDIFPEKKKEKKFISSISLTPDGHKLASSYIISGEQAYYDLNLVSSFDEIGPKLKNIEEKYPDNLGYWVLELAKNQMPKINQYFHKKFIKRDNLSIYDFAKNNAELLSIKDFGYGDIKNIHFITKDNIEFDLSESSDTMNRYSINIKKKTFEKKLSYSSIYSKKLISYTKTPLTNNIVQRFNKPSIKKYGTFEDFISTSSSGYNVKLNKNELVFYDKFYNSNIQSFDLNNGSFLWSNKVNQNSFSAIIGLSKMDEFNYINNKYIGTTNGVLHKIKGFSVNEIHKGKTSIVFVDNYDDNLKIYHKNRMVYTYNLKTLSMIKEEKLVGKNEDIGSMNYFYNNGKPVGLLITTISGNVYGIKRNGLKIMPMAGGELSGNTFSSIHYIEEKKSLLGDEMFFKITHNGEIYKFNRGMKLQKKIKAHSGKIISVNKYDDYIITSGIDNTIKVWNKNLINISTIETKSPVKIFTPYLSSDFKIIAIDSKNITYGLDFEHKLLYPILETSNNKVILSGVDLDTHSSLVCSKLSGKCNIYDTLNNNTYQFTFKKMGFKKEESYINFKQLSSELFYIGRKNLHVIFNSNTNRIVWSKTFDGYFKEFNNEKIILQKGKTKIELSIQDGTILNTYQIKASTKVNNNQILIDKILKKNQDYTLTGIINDKNWILLYPKDKVGQSYSNLVNSHYKFKVINYITDEHIIDIYILDDGWIFITPEGYYNASNNTDKYLTVGFGNLVYPIDAYRKKYYRPDIIEDIFKTGSLKKSLAKNIRGYDKKKSKDTVSFSVTPPAITIFSPNDGDKTKQDKIKLDYLIKDSSSKIEDVKIYINGRNITQRALKIAKKDDYRYSDTKAVSLDNGENIIKIIASNEIATSEKVIKVYKEVPKVKESTKRKQPLHNLWLLSIGVSQYENLPKHQQLSYADDDAKAIAKAFKKLEGKQYKKVYTKVIADGADIEPTGDNIVDNIDFVTQAGQYDTVLIFIAGHGLRDLRRNFYFLPKDVEFKKDGTMRKSSAIRYTDITEAIEGGVARSIMMVDTCHAEGMSGKKTRAIDNNEMLKSLQDTGSIIFTSSRGSEYSQESDEWGHGLFTYSILKGLDGEADIFPDKPITMKELDLFVSEEVSKQSNGTQHPITFIPGGYEDFIIYDYK